LRAAPPGSQPMIASTTTSGTPRRRRTVSAVALSSHSSPASCRYRSCSSWCLRSNLASPIRRKRADPDLSPQGPDLKLSPHHPRCGYRTACTGALMVCVGWGQWVETWKQATSYWKTEWGSPECPGLPEGAHGSQRCCPCGALSLAKTRPHAPLPGTSRGAVNQCEPDGI
jgi:hypothetical protein